MKHAQRILRWFFQAKYKGDLQSLGSGAAKCFILHLGDGKPQVIGDGFRIGDGLPIVWWPWVPNKKNICGEPIEW